MAKPASAVSPTDGSAATPTDEELKEFLKPVPPTPPAEALKTFETAGGFQMELVAAEPLVYNPVAAAFDEDGNLYVAEMRDYPYKLDQPVKVANQLRSPADAERSARCACCATPTATDVSTRAHVFADGLLWAARHRPVEGRRVRRRAAGHLVSEGHRRRRQGRRPRQGLHRLRHRRTSRRWSTTFSSASITRSTGRPAATAATSGRATIRRRPAVSVEGRDFRFDPVTRPARDGRPGRSSSAHLRRLGQPLPVQRVASGCSTPCCRSTTWRATRTLPVPRPSHEHRRRRRRSFASARSSAGGRSASSRRIAHGVRAADGPGVSHHVVDAGRRRDRLSRRRVPGGVLRQRLRRRRAEQSRPSPRA